jgi:hypothetical protein
MSADRKQKLELTWIGKENRPKLEPRILLEEPEKSYHARHKVANKDIFDNRLIPRLKKVIDGEDPGGITQAVNWKGCGGFRYYRLAPSLLVLCTAFRARADRYPNLTVKKIPRAVLARCEWGHDDYSLRVENLPQAPPPKGQMDLFGEEPD